MYISQIADSQHRFKFQIYKAMRISLFEATVGAAPEMFLTLAMGIVTIGVELYPEPCGWGGPSNPLYNV